MSDTKFCKDCKHYEGRGILGGACCIHPKIADLDPVSGEPEPRPCWALRMTRIFPKCGPKGKLWEAQAEARRAAGKKSK